MVTPTGHCRIAEFLTAEFLTEEWLLRLPILLLGYSFVKRLTFYSKDNRNFNLCLDSRYDVFFHGVSGLSLSRHGAELDMVRTLAPRIVFLEIGTNDLASPTTCPIDFANQVCIASSYAFQNNEPGPVISSGAAAPTPYAVDVVRSYNTTVADLCTQHGPVIFWRHRGLWSQWPHHLVDGVHFNAEGQRKYFNSVRGVLIAVASPLL